jgi:hypothetical protein
MQMLPDGLLLLPAARSRTHPADYLGVLHALPADVGDLSSTPWTTILQAAEPGTTFRCIQRVPKVAPTLLIV